MPTPIAHSLVGFIISSVSPYGRVFENNLLNFFLIIFVSVLPDLDLLPGMISGVMFKYHHGITHSFFAALVISFLLSFIIYIFQKKNILSHTFLFTIIYSLHIIFDLFGYDDGRLNGIGMPIFFPFNSDRYISTVIIFNGDLFKDGNVTLHSLLRYTNLNLIITEILSALLVGILLVTAVNFLKNGRLLNARKYE